MADPKVSIIKRFHYKEVPLYSSNLVAHSNILNKDTLTLLHNYRGMSWGGALLTTLAPPPPTHTWEAIVYCTA